MNGHRGVKALYVDIGDAAAIRRVAGIVEQAVQAAKAVDSMCDHGCHVMLNGNVGSYESRSRAEFGGQILASL